jgi:hypothetical protein
MRSTVRGQIPVLLRLSSPHRRHCLFSPPAFATVDAGATAPRGLDSPQRQFLLHL